ncbi:phosphotriesterase-related protein [Sporobacter termitidis DSM 10068]|uniref:Phosphotriesterase-related protein n=1 Tax=Sporobacter termitidis DSM 10068 TaxID=1123282 RepID=A0A1M5ZIL3_9FIRM|nr:amidohydrolase family protein [Sporobacter termitidis]SHI23949.1 phosphotriesterase-related protein [Sporobacter termitidis DSM 10068]
MGRKLTTVLGPVDGEDIGKTLVHEHFAFGFPGFAADGTLGGYDFDAVVKTGVQAAERARRHGVRTIVDATCNDCGRDPLLLRRIAEETGMNIVASTGYYYEGQGSPAYFKFRASIGDAVSEIYEMMVAELTDGIGKTGVKAGVIKIGSSKDSITDYEQLLFRAAARAQKETGAVIMTHTEAGTMGPEQADLLLSEGADPSRVIIGHMCGNTDIRYAVDVLKRGVYIALDRFGLEAEVFGTPKDADREALAIALIARGHINRLLFSHDTVNVNLGRPVKWPPSMQKAMEDANIGRIFEVIIPDLKRMGISDEQLDTILVKNPAKLYG